MTIVVQWYTKELLKVKTLKQAATCSGVSIGTLKNIKSNRIIKVTDRVFNNILSAWVREVYLNAN